METIKRRRVSHNDEKHRRDTWATPANFYAVVDDLFHPTIDVCATPSNAKCQTFIAPPGFTQSIGDVYKSTGRTMAGIDAMKASWAGHGPVAWCNPPYSDIMPWMMRAVEMQRHGVTTIMLSHHGLATKWFHAHAGIVAGLWILTPRIQFIAPKGIEGEANQRDSLLWIFSAVPVRPPMGSASSQIATSRFDWRAYGIERGLFKTETE